VRFNDDATSSSLQANDLAQEFQKSSQESNTLRAQLNVLQAQYLHLEEEHMHIKERASELEGALESSEQARVPVSFISQ